MKKVVVVVDLNQKEFFEGENIEMLETIRDTIEVQGYPLKVKDLEVKDGDVTLASFAIWMYWRQLE